MTCPIMAISESIDEFPELLCGCGDLGDTRRLLGGARRHQNQNYQLSRCIYSQPAVSLYYLMISYQLVSVLLLSLLALTASEECPKDAEEFLVTFHPHLDAFWLDTDDDLKDINFQPAGFLYAMNQRNSKTILNSMLQALTKDAARKYFVSEVVFFKDWYDYLSADKKKQVKKLFEKGQLDLSNGGWVENDEAVCYMDDIIDQYTIGHNFLNAEFGLTPKIGWATDSFGHSHSQVALQHLLGFEFQGIERIDDRYIYDRKDGSLLEFYWSAVSDSNGRKYGGVMTQVRHFLHEVNDLRHARPEGIAEDFRRLQANMKKLYKKNKLFRFLGNDFEEFIDEEFTNLESAFAILNSNNQKCPIYKYGNPSDYLEVIKKYYGETTPIREYDFMPNFDQDHYWSGYYTTNPELKKVCKDYSRLVNLFRKIYAKHLTNGGSENEAVKKLLQESDELLAVMQHHDGITATSKYHIEKSFRDKMNSKTATLIKTISQLKQLPKQSCDFHKGGNTCTLKSQDDKIFLSILHEGAPKKERIELILPASVTYDVLDDSDDELFCEPKQGICSLVFEPNLLSGENVFVLSKTERTKVGNSKADGTSYKDNDFSVNAHGSQFTYTFNGEEYIKVSYVQSSNRNSGTDTYTWDKYGNKIEKNQNRMAGIYIMANNGQLADLKFSIDGITVAKGKVFTKVYFQSKTNSIMLTIKNTQRNVIDLQTTFKPESRDFNDYFIKIDSKLNSNGEFYHDSNGYLVIRRQVGRRPDYNWNYKADDKINANTYPMCSFAYAVQDDKKIVVFTDRAQGLALYDSSLLVNIDRLAGDDYKGVGEGYFYQIENTFRHRIGIVSTALPVQREWQRTFDEALVGFYSNTKRETSSKGLLSDNSRFLKYTIFLLNSNEYVLRLFNLNEHKDIELPIYTSSTWNIDELNLHLNYSDIRESFANGIPLSERRVWNKVEGEVNILNADSKDTEEKLVLAPLQGRSFRINLKGKILGEKFEHKSSSKLELTLTDVKPVVKAFAKRCF